MSRKYIGGPLGHCKQTAARIRRDAEQIASRLAQGQTIKDLSIEYGCNVVTMVKHLTAVIGKERWRQLVHRRGPKPGQCGRPPAELSENPPPDAGPHCRHCTMPITPATRRCPNCGNLIQG